MGRRSDKSNKSKRKEKKRKEKRSRYEEEEEEKMEEDKSCEDKCFSKPVVIGVVVVVFLIIAAIIGSVLCINSQVCSGKKENPNSITISQFGEYGNLTVYKYVMNHSNGISVEVISLGARLYSLKKSSIDIVEGSTTRTTSPQDLADDTEGAWLGPVCGDEPDLHKVNFEKEGTDDDKLILKASTEGLDIKCSYSFSSNGELSVEIIGVTKGDDEQKMDICCTNRYNLNEISTEEINEHQLKIVANNTYAIDGSLEPVGGLADFRTLTSLENAITTTKQLYPSRRAVTYTYNLETTPNEENIILQGPIAKLVIKTNQPVVQLYIEQSALDYVRLTIRSYPIMYDPSVDEDKVTLHPGSSYTFFISYAVE